MQNKEGIFSSHELSQLKDFCDNCAKEDKKIYEERKKNPSYIPKDEKPGPNEKSKISSYKNDNNNGNAKIQKNYINATKSNNHNIPKSNNNSKQFSESFQKKLKMYEPKK